jgi:VanZ family protein|tara:strand:+ start:314 stop:718 length:405 start_codon:yes stop_codon:yes gene_type:complete
MLTVAVWLARACFIVLLGVLAFFSLVSADNEMNISQFIPWDKASHFISYFLLTLVGILAFPSVPLIVIGVAILAQSALVEAVQPYVGRSRDLYDLMANALGISGVLAPVVVFRLREFVKQRRRLNLEAALGDRS